MARPKQAVILRVHRHIAGRVFPWDCVYFFRREEEPLLPRVFPCSLVLPMNKRFTQLVKKAFENPYGDRGKDRAFPQHRKDEDRLNERIARTSTLTTVLSNRKDYIALVPTLHLRGRYGQGASGPVYLTARPRAPASRIVVGNTKNRGKFASAFSARDKIIRRLMQEAFSSKAYFLFRGEKIQPPCLCCPNNLDFLNGKCAFGLETCYDSLDQAREGDFVEALGLYKTFFSAQEPEVADEQLSRDAD